MLRQPDNSQFPLPTTWLGSPHYDSYFVDPIAAANEESLANAYVARHIRRYYRDVGVRGLTRAYWGLRSFMDRQPGPYDKYGNFLRNEDYASGRDDLIDKMYQPWISSSALADQPSPGALLGSGIYFADVTPLASDYPVYLVLDRRNRMSAWGNRFRNGSVYRSSCTLTTIPRFTFMLRISRTTSARDIYGRASNLIRTTDDFRDAKRIVSEPMLPSIHRNWPTRLQGRLVANSLLCSE